jgi:hypothetical protein
MNTTTRTFKALSPTNLLTAWLMSATLMAWAPAQAITSNARGSSQLQTELNLKIRFSDASNIPQGTKLAKKMLGDQVDLSQFKEQVDFDAKGYRINSEIPMPKVVSVASSLDRVRRLSEGELTNTGLQGSRIMEQRGSKADIYEARVSKDKKKVEFFKNRKKTHDESIGTPYTDLTSLPYFWLGRPVKPNSITVDVIDAKRLYKRQVLQAKALDIQYLGQRIKAVQFTKAQKSATDSELVILVRQSDGMPLRIDLGLSGKYGVSALIYPTNIPGTLSLNTSKVK